MEIESCCRCYELFVSSYVDDYLDLVSMFLVVSYPNKMRRGKRYCLLRGYVWSFSSNWFICKHGNKVKWKKQDKLRAFLSCRGE